MPDYGPPPPANNPPNKVFQASRIGKPFKGTLEEEGKRARDFIARFEMMRLATPGLTSPQLISTAVVNLQDDAEAWYYVEDTKFY